MVENKRWRTIIFYKNYFSDFFVQQRLKVKAKIIWTFDLIEEHERVPEKYLKHLEDEKGLYEIKVQLGNNEIRIFCFFDKESLVILANGFYKKTQKTPKGEIEKALKIKNEYEIEKSNTKTLAEFKDEHFGKRGTPKRERLEAGYETFKLGAMIQEARLEQGMTQEELAEKCGTTKSYISKLENDVKEVRISTLQKIVHDGLDGELQLNIKLRQRSK